MTALSLENEDFARQCVDLYEALSCKAVKQYQTPHVDPASLVVSDDAPRGELSASAASMVMKLLWLARISRPDILVAVTLLAVNVTTWSINEDRMVARLVGYVSYSAHYSLCFSSLYVDTDFGGCLHTARSTSGMFSPLRVQRRLRCWHACSATCSKCWRNTSQAQTRLRLRKPRDGSRAAPGSTRFGTGSSWTQMALVNMICLGTCFQLAEIVRIGPGQPTSAKFGDHQEAMDLMGWQPWYCAV